MSSKTENIYKAIDNLDQLQQRILNYYNQNPDRELDNIQFEMQQNLKNLRFLMN